MRAYCLAYNLPTDSNFHKARQDPRIWSDEKQLLSSLDLHLRRIFWAISFTMGKDLDQRKFSQALEESPPPEDLILPDYFRKMLDDIEENKEQQKRAELAAAASKENIENMKLLLNKPRLASEEEEAYDE